MSNPGLSNFESAVVLQWLRFRKLTEARSKMAKQPCVYIQTDSHGQILRIGAASKGLNVRYRGGTGYAIDAAMHGSGNYVYAVSVPKEICKAVEAMLIYREKPVYNNQGKTKPPLKRLRLRHSGDTPAFRSHYSE